MRKGRRGYSVEPTVGVDRGCVHLGKADFRRGEYSGFIIGFISLFHCATRNSMTRQHYTHLRTVKNVPLEQAVLQVLWTFESYPDDGAQFGSRVNHLR